MKINLKSIFSIKNGNAYGYGYSKIICILGHNLVVPKPPYVGFKRIKDKEETDRLIGEYINSRKPFMLIRFGNSEIRPVITYLKSKNKSDVKFSPDEIDLLKNNASFFSANNEEVIKFSQEAIDIIKDADFIPPVIRNSSENFMTNIAKKSKLVSWQALDILQNLDKTPYWLSCLEGKKVLVIHPFAKTIQEQYKKREKLFKNPELIPQFDLKTITAVQGLDNQTAEKYSSWWDALYSMYEQIEKEDFDIALIGAGAFGMFLANKVKECGKQAIQLCGSTQLLFGIKGSRWAEYNIYNEYWVSPSEEETPKNLSQFIIGESNKAYW